MISKTTEFLTHSFIKYTKINTQSCTETDTLPSSPGQTILAKTLKADLECLGIKDIILETTAVLIAKIPGNTDAPSISFMSHIDTVDIGASPDVRAQVLPFKGEDIILNKEKNIVFKVSDHPDIKNYIGQDIIFTDGTSVLGADDKAGVVVMMGIARYLMTEKPMHGDIYLVFVPDEEIGLKGAYSLDLKKLPVDLSYTVDGGPIGEFGYETFNGAGVQIHIKGITAHPGAGKGIIVNPILTANDIISKMDKFDTPEHSEKKEGFFMVHDIKGNPSYAQIEMIIRDFDLKKFNARKQHIQNIIQEVKLMNPKAEITYEISDSYANIANNLSQDNTCIQIVEEAMKNLEIPILVYPIRGGTDGAVLSSKGLPTPNLFTGACNIHSIFEYLPVPSLYQSFALTVEIIKLSASKYKFKGNS
ncbi:MAG: peptidase T [Brevinemataceae bacterium]